MGHDPPRFLAGRGSAWLERLVRDQEVGGSNPLAPTIFYKKMNKTKRTESAGGVVVNSKGEILVVSQHGTSWSLPKGHIDQGEDALEAAKREIFEESGISELVLIKDLGSYERHRIGLKAAEDRSELKSIRMYLFKTAQTKLSPRDPDNPEARWVKKETVAELLTHDKDKAFFKSISGLIPSKVS